jgi:hypothetical protein
MSRFENLRKRIEEVIEEFLARGAGEVPIIKDIPLHPLLITCKLSSRASNALILSQTPGGVGTVAFWSSTGSASLYTASLICQLGSNVVVYVNCSRFAPLLTAFGVVTEKFADKIGQYGNGTI